MQPIKGASPNTKHRFSLGKKARSKAPKLGLQAIRDVASPTSTIGQVDGSSNGTRAKTIREALKAAGAD